MGAAIIITVGILFLIQNFSSFDFGQTWPVLLIVIGVFVYLTRTASLEGHVPRYYAVGPVVPPPPGQNPPPPQSDSQVNP
jgi:hypothetical protein